MSKNKKNKKGKKRFSFLRTIIKIACLVVVFGVILFLLGKGGIGIGDGNDDGDDTNNSNTTITSPDAVDNTDDTEDTEDTDDTDSTGDTEEAIQAEYVYVSVSGNEYLYQNRKVSLEELIEELANTSTDFSVKITDENASQKAYRELVEVLEEHNIPYIEDNTK